MASGRQKVSFVVISHITARQSVTRKEEEREDLLRLQKWRHARPEGGRDVGARYHEEREQSQKH